MSWNWQKPNWPNFFYNLEKNFHLEKEFYVKTGAATAFLKTINREEFNQFVIEILSLEGSESSKIEGEFIDRESLQSSLRKHFGLQNNEQKVTNIKEAGMAEVLCSVYETFDQPLSHTSICCWHNQLFRHGDNFEIGQYRSHADPMQIISTKLGYPKVYFEAPPSAIIYDEMEQFIHWFNQKKDRLPILGRAAIAHVYFESIHPFEDGNGRIGRLLVEKILSQEFGQPILIAVSKILEKQKKSYYASLETCNRSLQADVWVEFFSKAILQAQEDSINHLYFLIKKAKVLSTLAGNLNSRQEKVLLRMFAEGPAGFKGGLTAEKYVSITKTSKATATRDLNDLVDKQALFKTGELRHTRYWLS